MNKDEFIKLLSSADIDEDTKEVEGISVSVFQEHDRDSREISQTLLANGINATFKRAGLKVISYERWVETNWFDWDYEY